MGGITSGSSGEERPQRQGGCSVAVTLRQASVCQGGGGGESLGLSVEASLSVQRRWRRSLGCLTRFGRRRRARILPR